MMSIACPSCQKDDMVQKVTAIVEGETFESSGYSVTNSSTDLSGQGQHYSDYSGHIGRTDISGSVSSQSSTRTSSRQSSRLADRLRPPSRPARPREPKLYGSLFEGAGDSEGGGYAGMAAGCLFWFLAFAILVEIFGSTHSDMGKSVALAVGALPLAGILMALASTIIDGIYNVIKYPPEKKQRLMEEYQQKLKDYEDREFQWAMAMDRWNSMFYCRRCDVVYIRGEQQFAAPGQAGQLLYLVSSKAKRLESSNIPTSAPVQPAPPPPKQITPQPAPLPPQRRGSLKRKRNDPVPGSQLASLPPQREEVGQVGDSPIKRIAPQATPQQVTSDTFNVVLVAVDSPSLEIQRLIMRLSGCSNDDAKYLLNSIPENVLWNVDEGTAHAAKVQIEAVGGVAEIIKTSVN